MFFKYLGRELTARLRQTILMAIGLAVSVALVIVVNAASTGIAGAQKQVLSSLYGIGTDISISKTQTTADFRPPQFNIGGSTGTTRGQTRKFDQNQLRTQPGVALIASTVAEKVAATSGVATTVSTLKLESVSFSGTLPTFTNFGNSNSTGGFTPGGAGSNGAGSTNGTGGTTGSNPSASFGPTGGFDGKGGSSFSINRFSVEGIPLDASTSKVGPLSAISVSSGRLLTTSDSNIYVAVLDKTYAAGANLKVGSKATIGGKSFEVVGIVTSNSSSASTESNAYIPLDVAQTLSGDAAKVSNIYVSAASADAIPTVKSALQKLDTTLKVNTSADLASTVSGSLSDAAGLVNNLGAWLSLLVLLTAFAIAALFTVSGVNRRFREFGTLKALGWPSRRIVSQVMGESVASGILGGVVGALLGVVAVFAINVYSPALSGAVQQSTGFNPGGFGGQGGFGGFGGPGRLGGFGGPGSQTAATAVKVSLNAVVSPSYILLGIGFALLGGLLAGAIGGLRAARLSPAQALRSVA